jgi:plastocyanin
MLLIAGACSPAASDAPKPARHVVEISAMTFHPAELEVRRGDTVVWINRDIVPHTGLGTGPLEQGRSGSFVPAERGSVPYICDLHPTMRGKLLVR